MAKDIWEVGRWSALALALALALARAQVLSLEVGEHLPKEFEDAFIENLHRHNARGMVLSWATKGQGGTGHVNEQDNDYVKAAVCAMGYANDLEAERELRSAARFSYFQRTVMVFRRVQ